MPEVFFRFCIFKITGRWKKLTDCGTISAIPGTLHSYKHDASVGDMVAHWNALFYETAPPPSSSDSDGSTDA